MTQTILGGAPQRASTVHRRVDISHEQRGVLPRQFLQATHHKHHVYRRALGSKTALLLRQDAFPFAVVDKAARDDYE